jgi:PAS domain S-box-containing protein
VKFWVRLMLMMVALVLLTATTEGLLTYRNLEAAILPIAAERLLAHTRGLAADLDAYIHGARSDVLAASNSAAMQGVIRARLAGGVDPRDDSTEAMWLARMAENFAALLSAKPTYVQLRYIGVADAGREIVRVDRSGANGSIRIVPPANLQPKGDRPYFKETIQLAAGQVYISPIELNQENSIIETPHLPVLRAATPLYTPDGDPFGIVIINMDMRPLLDRLRTSASAGGAIYLINERGDYLVHPDPSREFGFDLGKPSRIQDDQPAVADLLASNEAAVRMIGDGAGHMAAAIVPVQLLGGPRVALVETVPQDELTTTAASVRRSSLIAGLAAVFGALLLAGLLARSLTRPLVRMTAAVEAFPDSAPLDGLASASGELGILARAFAHMSNEVRDKTAALERELDERRRAEAEREQLSARARLFSAVVESSDDAILTKTLDGTLTAWNPGAERLYGFAAQEAVGQHIDIIVPEERRDEVRDILARIRNGERVEHFETVRRSKAGRLIDVSITFAPIKSSAGAITGTSVIARDITGQKHAEERFRLAVESSPSGMVMVDSAGIITLVNAETERLFGYGREELLGQPVDLLVPERFRAAHPQLRGAFAAHPSTRSMGAGRDLYGLRKDGSEFAIEIGLNPIETSQGIQTLAAVVDITERRRAEAALREREEYLRVLTETMPAVPWSATPDGQIDYFSQRWLDLTGLTREQALGEGWVLVAHPDDRPQMLAAWAHALATGEPYDVIHRIHLADGSYRWQRSRALPQRDAAGRIVRWHGITDDIHELRLAEERVRASEERFAKAFQASPAALVITRQRDRVQLDVNESYCELIGWPRDELIGRTPLAQEVFVHPEQLADLRAVLQTEQRLRNREITIRTRSGELGTVLFSVVGVPLNGEPCFLTIMVDITERKRAEAALAEQAQELQRSNTDLQQFAYVASHDLQEPLRMVASYTELLGERYRGKLDEKADKYIRYAVEGARRMQQLVNDLLAYSRIGTQGKQLQPIDSDGLLRRVLNGMRATIEESGATILYSDLPVINADGVQLGQLFQNLISNAIKFHGDQPPRIQIGAEPVDGSWVFSVADNGIGIEQTYADRIFQIFQRLHERGKYEGSGIGLAIVKRIVDRHGGRIWFESEIGSGTTFFFTMPAPGEVSHNGIYADTADRR